MISIASRQEQRKAKIQANFLSNSRTIGTMQDAEPDQLHFFCKNRSIFQDI
jgi:hypothetical protein